MEDKTNFEHFENELLKSFSLRSSLFKGTPTQEFTEGNESSRFSTFSQNVARRTSGIGEV